MAYKPKLLGVVGLGMVGLPTAAEFAAAGIDVIGYDIDAKKIAALQEGTDPTQQGLEEKLKHIKAFTSRPTSLIGCDAYLVCVPTGLKDHQPDLGPIESTAEMIGQTLKAGDLYVLESSVYPGVTEGVALPRLLEKSGLSKEDINYGHCPERVNPGDAQHGLTQVPRVYAGNNEETAEMMRDLYSLIVPNLHRVNSIRLAEFTKVGENTARDVMIAIMNELAGIAEAMDLDFKEALEAMRTKFSFPQNLGPGLVGGHCIPVDPWYLIHAAESAGHDSELLPTARRVNDSQIYRILDSVEEHLSHAKENRVYIRGFSYKEGVADPRNPLLNQLVEQLRNDDDIIVMGGDARLSSEIVATFGAEPVNLDELKERKTDALILTVPDQAFMSLPPERVREFFGEDGLFYDVQGRYPHRKALEEMGVRYKSL